MIAIVIALVALFIFVLCIAGTFSDKIKKQVDYFESQFCMEKEYWARKYDVEFSQMADRVKRCENSLKELDKNSRIQTQLKKYPFLKESFFRDAVRHITDPDYEGLEIEIIAEKLNKMVEPFLPKMHSEKSTKKTQ